MRMAFNHTNYLSNVFKLLTQWLLLLAACLLMLCLAGCKEHVVGVLSPKGIIAHEERRLFFDTLALMLIVVLPVIVMSFTFVYHYQVSHRSKEYRPNWSHSYFLEALWWGYTLCDHLCVGVFNLEENIRTRSI